MTRRGDAIIWEPYFPADCHARRLEAIGKEIDQVRAAMRLLGEGPPDDPIRRAGNMLATISAAHFKEAARLREPEPADEPEPKRNHASASVKRKQVMLLTVVTAIMLLLSARWIFREDDRFRDLRTSAGTVNDPWDKARAEREWIAESQNGYGQDDER